MTILQKLQLKQSEIREQLNTLLGLDTRTEEQDTELGKLTTEGQKIEPEIRAAIIAAPDEQTVVTPTDDPEQRERLELRAKARVSDFLVARLRGQAGHWGVFGVQPIGGLRGRDPDVVAARTGNPRGCGNPGTRHASDDAAPDPRLRVSSARSTRYLGVQVVSQGEGDGVYPVVTSALTGGMAAAGVAADSAAAALSPSRSTPLIGVCKRG